LVVVVVVECKTVMTGVTWWCKKSLLKIKVRQENSWVPWWSRPWGLLYFSLISDVWSCFDTCFKLVLLSEVALVLFPCFFLCQVFVQGTTS